MFKWLKKLDLFKGARMSPTTPSAYMKEEWLKHNAMHNERLCSSKCDYHKNEPRQYAPNSGIYEPTNND